MGRRPDPEKQKLRVEAARLEREEGLEAPQIAAKMGHEVQTVRSWLRAERGPKKVLFKPKVLELLEEGEKDLLKISKKVGCGLENVLKIEKDWRGFLKRHRRSSAEMLEDFFSDPQAKLNASYTRSKTFGRAMVDECNRAMTANPEQAKEIIELAAKQFSHIRKRLSAPEKIRHVACNQAQVQAIAAARERALADSHAGRERALEILRLARDLAGDCLACHADLARRESKILGELERFDDAFGRLDDAEHTYREMGHHGHDGLRNGLGSCAAERVGLFCNSGQPRKAVRVASDALKTLVTKNEAVLFYSLRHNSALSLLEIPGRSSEARVMIYELMQEVGEGTTVARLFLVFMAGRAAEKDGDFDAALHYFEDAYEYALELRIREAISALEADIARLTGDPKNFRERIERLREVGEKEFPSWLKPISDILDRASDLAMTDFKSAVFFLRQEGGGNACLPLGALS